MQLLTELWNQIETLFNSVNTLPPSIQGAIAFGFLAVGGLFCFVGYYFIKYLLGLAGFLTTGVFGLSAAYSYFPGWPEIAHFVIAAAAGAVGAVIFYFLFFYFGFFVFGAVAAMWLALLILPSGWGVYRSLATLGAGFSGGVAVLLLRKQLLIAATAAIGAICIVAGIGHFQGWPLSPAGLMQPYSLEGAMTASLGRLEFTHQLVIYGLIGLFLIAGIAVQSILPERKEEKKR